MILSVIQLKWLLHMLFQGKIVPWPRILLTSLLILFNMIKYSINVCVCVCVHTGECWDPITGSYFSSFQTTRGTPE